MGKSALSPQPDLLHERDQIIEEIFFDDLSLLAGEFRLRAAPKRLPCCKTDTVRPVGVIVESFQLQRRLG